MKDQLTERQRTILNFIEQFRDEAGYPPTLREIGKQFGIASTFGVKRHLEALEKKGYITVENNASRGINLLKIENSVAENSLIREDSTIYRQVPIIGRVAAGSPIMAIENMEGNLIIDPSFTKRADDSFALKVKGDSMIEAGIFEGDMVIVSPSTQVNTNDIAVAMINGEVTVKTLIKKNNQVTLKPQNNKYQPINVSENDDFKLVGKVVGVVRWIS